MKKGVVIGIVSGVVAANIMVVGLIGAYLSKAKAASGPVREHNGNVQAVNKEVDAVLGN